MTYQYPFISASEWLKLQVWAKGAVVPGYDPAKVRRDQCGNWMVYADHGNINSTYGWEIDYIYPASRGGGDHISNLQPLWWRNNRSKGDGLNWSCALRAAS